MPPRNLFLGYYVNKSKCHSLSMDFGGAQKIPIVGIGIFCKEELKNGGGIVLKEALIKY